MQGNEAVGAVSNVLLKTLSPDRAQVSTGIDGCVDFFVCI